MNAMRPSVVGWSSCAPWRRGRRARRAVAAAGGLALVALLAPGCGGEDPAPGAGAAGTAGGSGGGGGAAAGAAEAPERAPVDPGTTGSVAGVVRVQGDVPEPRTFAPTAEDFCIRHSGGKLRDESLLASGGLLENAFVWIPDGLGRWIFPEPEGAVALDQEGCLFTQRVLGVRVGQEIELHNSDPVLHNVNFKGRANKPANYAIPAGGDPRTTSLRKPEIAVPVVCDVHPWMYASVAVVDHPCFAVTDASGAFTIDGVPPGSYTLRAWHEKLGTREVTVTVEPGGAATAPDLVFTVP